MGLSRRPFVLEEKLEGWYQDVSIAVVDDASGRKAAA